MKKVVIIGGGHAAAESVTALKQNGWDGEITLVSDEPHLPYQRPPLSKAYFNNKVSADNLLIKKQPVYEKCQANLKLGKPVSKIDRAKRQVFIEEGEILDYSHLIIATGTRARKLSIPGTDIAPVHYLRTLDDVSKIKQNVKPNSKLLIIGAGYIGLEIAASAVKMGIQVTVLEAMDRVLARVTCPAMSDFYQQLHREEGVDLRLNTSVNAFEKNGDDYQAILADGTQLAFDNVIVGIGVLPNIEIADEAGLDINNGILVDQYSQSSDPRIFAIGDCSNHPNSFYNTKIRLESVPNAIEQAKTAAATICAKDRPNQALPWFWSDQYDVKLQTAGLSIGFDDFVIRGNPATRKFCIFYLKNAQIIAVDAVNSGPDFMKAKQLIPQKLMIDKQKLADISSKWFE